MWRLHSRSLVFAVLLSVSDAAAPGCASDDGGVESVGSDAGSGKTDGLSQECKNLPPGPFEPVSLGHSFDGSEDFTFDGVASMVARRRGEIVRVNSAGQVTKTIAASFNTQTLGLRYHPNGDLVGAMVGEGRLVRVKRNGRVTNLFTGLNGPNGVFVGLDGNVWFTEGGANRVSRLAPGGQRTTIVSGADKAQGANGVVVNAATKQLFYTEFDKGKIHRVDLAQQTPPVVDIATIPGSGLDGLVLDACGNLYVVDQKRSKLFRVRLDADGDAIAAPELLASFPNNVANAQFGSGDGFDAKTLFVVGNPGSVFAVPVAVSGAPVPTPPQPLECAHTFELPGTGNEQNVEARGDYRPKGWDNGAPMTFDAAAKRWKATVLLPANIPVEYKFHFFVSDAEVWVTDPNNPDTQNGNSVLRGVTCTPE